MLQNTRFTAFTVSELLRENQQREGGITPHHPDWGLNLMAKTMEVVKRSASYLNSKIYRAYDNSNASAEKCSFRAPLVLLHQLSISYSIQTKRETWTPEQKYLNVAAKEAATEVFYKKRCS